MGPGWRERRCAGAANFRAVRRRFRYKTCMKTIVTLVDFSAVTARVIDQSQQMAKAFGAQIVILHAVPKQAVVLDLGVASPTVLQAPSAKKIEADYEKLVELRDGLASSGAAVSVCQLEEASVENLLGECQRLAADLIIVGAHHHGALYNWFVGGFTRDLLQQTVCPVLVVPER